jgi:hypothetical protein
MLNQDAVHWFDDDKTPEEEERESLVRLAEPEGDVDRFLSRPGRPPKYIEL